MGQYEGEALQETIPFKKDNKINFWRPQSLKDGETLQKKIFFGMHI